MDYLAAIATPRTKRHLVQGVTFSWYSLAIQLLCQGRQRGGQKTVLHSLGSGSSCLLSKPGRGDQQLRQYLSILPLTIRGHFVRILVDGLISSTCFFQSNNYYTTPLVTHITQWLITKIALFIFKRTCCKQEKLRWWSVAKWLLDFTHYQSQGGSEFRVCRWPIIHLAAQRPSVVWLWSVMAKQAKPKEKTVLLIPYEGVQILCSDTNDLWFWFSPCFS